MTMGMAPAGRQGAVTRGRSPGGGHQRAVSSGRSPGGGHQRAVTRGRSPGGGLQGVVTRGRSPGDGLQGAVSSGRSPGGGRLETGGNSTDAAAAQGHVAPKPVVFLREGVCSSNLILLFVFHPESCAHVLRRNFQAIK